jgi:hypothetical protein
MCFLAALLDIEAGDAEKSPRRKAPNTADAASRSAKNACVWAALDFEGAAEGFGARGTAARR